MFRFFLLVSTFGAFCSITKGDILCYSCISQGGGDDTCVTNPAAVVNPIVKCQDKKKYCTIRRLENTAEPGTIYSFLRGCEENPLPNGENPGEDIVVWAQSCSFADLCNVGDGLSEITPDNVGGGNGNNGNVIIVPVPSSSNSLCSGKLSALIVLMSTAFMIGNNSI